LFPGRIIANRYRVLRVLGRGGMGVVSEVEEIQTAERYAIKFLREDVESDMQPNARFLREAKLATRLTSPHTCRVLKIGEWELGPYIVMELLEGRSLSSILERGRQLDWQKAARIAYEICDSLAEAHALGIVHRDVKPGNVYLANMPDARVVTKMLDFGVAKIPGSVVTKHGEPSLTDASTLLGTPSYVAPEQLINSKLVDARADIWAVGVMLYEMLAGQLPFSSPLVPKLLVMIAKDDPQPLAPLVPAVPQELVQIVQRCLLKDPSQRFADAASLARALMPWLDSADDVLLPLMHVPSLRPSLRPSEPAASEPTRLEVPAYRVADSLGPHTTANIAKHKSVQRSRLRSIAAGASLGILAAAILLGAAAKPSGKPTTSPHPAPALASGSATPSQSTHRVLLMADPAQARMQLDQTALAANPASLLRADDGQEHEWIVSAPGFVTERRTLRFNIDQQLTISLRQLRTEPRRTVAQKSPVRPTRGGSTTPHVPSPAVSRTRSLDQDNPF
jgi:eukaryotic-like serine/threonine-protein kinase